MQIIKVALDQIIPYENNVKEHPQEQIEQIKKSIQDFGNNDPIAIDDNNVIIEGHGRFMALQELGFKEVECIVLSGLSEDQKNAYRLVHNKLTMNSGFDFEKLQHELNKISLDMSIFDFDMDEIMKAAGNELEAEEDEFNVEEALEEESIVKQGELWRLGCHFLLCGDSTQQNAVLRLMQGNKADLFLTDPPYNVNYEGTAGKIENDNMQDADFRTFLIKAFSCADQVLKEGASFYIWHADSEGYNFRGACYDIGWQIRQCLIWVKNSLVMGRQDYQWKHEPCLYGWKDGAAHYFIDDRTQTTVIEDKVNINSMNKEELKEYVKELLKDKVATTIINEDKPLANDLHPTMKPIKLFAYLIKNSSKQENIVFDLFGGSGSTLIACEQLNRHCFTIELDEKYASVIIKRWEALTGQKAERVIL